MEAKAKLTPNFRQIVASDTSGEKVLPILRAHLWDPNFQGFTVSAPSFEHRAPDGWFHPSTHPLWTERQLFYYLAEPQGMVNEPFDPQSTMAVTVGHLMHDFIQHVLLGAGLLQAAEVPFSDEETRSRGHADGIGDDFIFEYKTMNPTKLNNLGTLEDFIAKCPEYYAQQQEYQRLSGYRESRVVIQATSYPYALKEFTVPYNPNFALGIRDKYKRVLSHVEQGIVPQGCCAPRSKDAKVCPARGVCEIGRM